MNNENLGSFVEYNREKCKKYNSYPLDPEVNFSNNCILHIVCEEASIRWFTIIEEEDVMIDDFHV